MISKTVKLSVVVMLVLGCCSLEAQQERKGKPNPEWILTKLDTDENGMISFDEFKLAPMNLDFKDEVVAKRFSRMDVDDNGEVNLEELKQALRHMRHRRGEHRKSKED